jgi:hypothetical protein
MAKYSLNVKPTEYSGVLFRSRLEARWAVFFDALDIRWEYEYERFSTIFEEEELSYLPDFYLKDFDTWVEVKHEYSEEEHELIRKIFASNLLPVKTQSYNIEPNSSGLLFLGNLPNFGHHDGYMNLSHILYQKKYGYRNPVVEISEFQMVNDKPVLNNTVNVTEVWNRFTFDNYRVMSNIGTNGGSAYEYHSSSNWVYSCPKGMLDERIKEAYLQAKSAFKYQ